MSEMKHILEINPDRYGTRTETQIGRASCRERVLIQV